VTGVVRISPLVRPGTENTCSGPNASPLRCIATVTRFIGFSHRGSLSTLATLPLYGKGTSINAQQVPSARVSCRRGTDDSPGEVESPVPAPWDCAHHAKLKGLRVLDQIRCATLYKYLPSIEAILLAWHEYHLTGHLEPLAGVQDQTRDAAERLEAGLEGVYALISHEIHRAHGAELAALLYRGQHVALAR
jgi:hypothetical protein